MVLFSVIVVFIPEMFLETFLTEVTSESMNDGSYMFIHWKFSPALNQSTGLNTPHPKNTLQSLLQIGPFTTTQTLYDKFINTNSNSLPVYTERINIFH